MKLFKRVFEGKYRKLLKALPLTVVLLSATATPTFADVSKKITEDSLPQLHRDFEEAWKKKQITGRKDNLYKVCNADRTPIPLQICLDDLETFLEVKKESIIQNCYRRRLNMTLCTGFVNLDELEQWINELRNFVN